MNNPSSLLSFWNAGTRAHWSCPVSHHQRATFKGTWTVLNWGTCDMETLCSFQPVGSLSVCMCVCVCVCMCYQLPLQRSRLIACWKPQNWSFEQRDQNIRTCDAFWAFETWLDEWVTLASTLTKVQGFVFCFFFVINTERKLTESGCKRVRPFDRPYQPFCVRNRWKFAIPPQGLAYVLVWHFKNTHFFYIFSLSPARVIHRSDLM